LKDSSWHLAGGTALALQWEKIKTFFKKEIPVIANKLMR